MGRPSMEGTERILIVFDKESRESMDRIQAETNENRGKMIRRLLNQEIKISKIFILHLSDFLIFNYLLFFPYFD